MPLTKKTHKGKKMKKLILFLLLLLSTQACATNLDLRFIKKYDNIDPEFKPYITEFIQISDGKVNKDDFYGFTMGFREYDKNTSVVGTCHYIVNEVDINVEWWNSHHSPSERLELVFHEFGHCILKRGHANKPVTDGFTQWLERLGFKVGLFTEKGYLYDGCPASFMHPYTIGERCINKHFYYYIKELFYQEDTMNYVETRKEQEHFFYENRCREPEVINKTDKWTERDTRSLNSAKRTCLKTYKSCLKTFIKKEHLNYYAICE
jgi:hypothetical protein